MTDSANSVASHRFLPDAAKLDAFFARYEEERRFYGIATTLLHVSPAQRIDTITTILGLNQEGWQLNEGDSAAKLWLRYLTPVLAETRESVAALSSAVDQGLPGRFDPPLADEPEGPDGVEPVTREKPIKSGVPNKGDEKVPVPKAPWRIKLAAWLNQLWVALRSSRLMGLAAAAIALATVFAALHYTGTDARIWKWLLPDPVPCPTCIVIVIPPPDPSPVPHTGNGSPTPDPLDPAGADYRIALAVTLAAASQHNNDVTPRELAQIFAGESDISDQPEVFLAAMLRRWPELPDLPIRRDESGRQALMQYAAAFATIESGKVAVVRELRPDDQEDTRLRRLIDAFASSSNSNHAAQTRSMPGQTWPHWLPYSVFALLLLALIIAALTYPAAVKASLANPPEGLRGTPFSLPLDGLVLSALPPERKLARNISWREPVIGRRMHADRSIRATLARGGFLSVVMRKRSLLAEYVFLVNRRRLNDHESARVSRLIETLFRAGANVTTYDYDPDPRTITARQRDENAPLVTFDLRGLRERHPDARLVLVTDGSELVDYFTLDPLPFVAEELATWPGRMLLTPVPFTEWGEREMKIVQALQAPVGRATVEGFQELASVFGERQKPAPRRVALPPAGDNTDLLKRTVAWLVDAQRRMGVRQEPAARPATIRLDSPFLRSDMPPPSEDVDMLLRELHAWLGPRGFHWLAACAHYPELRFPVTTYLGLRISIDHGGKKIPLYSEALLAQLTLLPWFRSGHMPPWLRQALLASLTDGAFELIRQAVADMLKGEPLLPGGQMLPKDAKLPIWLSGNEGMDIPLDAVLADVLTPDPDPRAPVLDEETVSRVLGPHRRNALGVRAMILGGVALWCAAAWWLWPDPAATPHTQGAWLPLIALVLCTAVVPAIALWLSRETYSRSVTADAGEGAP